MTILARLVRTAQSRGEARALHTQGDSGETVEDWTFAELARRSAGVAVALAAQTRPGERLVLAYPQGPAFLAAFFGALMAGAVPVPVAVPRRNEGAKPLAAIAADAGAHTILTAGSAAARLDGICGPELALLDTSALPSADLAEALTLCPPLPTAESLAFLQYTSGSTGRPRGVKITHGNIAANQHQIAAAFGLGSGTVIGSWLPMFHDMGLAAVLQAVWLGVPCYLMSPAAFVRRPARWLELIARHGVTTSGGPDFAYARCVEVADDLARDCDLSCWSLAFNGAEPVRPRTLERFAEAFSRFGFSARSFYPVYGLAEATAFVSGPQAGTGAEISHFDAQALAAGRALPDGGRGAMRLASCGRVRSGTRLRIVDPATESPVRNGEVGEIWISGGSVTPGYWGQEGSVHLSATGHLAGNSTAYLRTGDLGFRSGGHLFIAGRLKDLIIWNGRNVHPQQIEEVAAEAHPAIDPLGAVAFAVPEHEGEAVVVALERRRRAATRGEPGDNAAIARAVRAAVLRHTGVPLRDVLLLAPNTIDRTTSGKPRRAACRARYLGGDWARQAQFPPTETAEQSRQEALADRYCDWLRTYAPAHVDSRTIDERRTIPPHVVLDLGRTGILGMMAGEAWGGAGLGHRAALRVLARLGAIDLTLCLFVGLNNYLGLRPLQRFASAPLRDALLPDLARGRSLAAFALSEPGAGSNPRAICATARALPGRLWQIDGTKIWSGAAAWAGTITVFARETSADGTPGGYAAFAVDRDTPGLAQGPEALTMGMRGLIQNSVILSGVQVPEVRRLGPVGGGMAVAADAMMHARLAIAGGCVGALRRCAQIGLAYAQERRISTGLLGAHPMVRETLAGIVADAEALEGLVTAAATRADRAEDLPEAVFAACKALGPELLWAGADAVAQMLGGRGYIETGPMAQILRDARVLRVFEGPTETMRAFLGARLAADAAGLAAAVSAALDDTAVAADLMDLARRAADCAPALAAAGWEPSDSGHWLHQRTGEAAALALLAAGARRSGSGKAIAAAAGRWNHALAALDPAKVPAPPPRDLAALVERSAGRTGSVPVRFDPEPNPVRPVAVPPPTARSARSASDVAGWLCGWLRRRTGQDVSAQASFADAGLDSLGQLEMVEALSAWSGCRLDDTAPWDFPTVAALSAHVAEGPTAAEPGASDGPAGLLSALDTAIARLSREAGATP